MLRLAGGLVLLLALAISFGWSVFMQPGSGSAQPPAPPRNPSASQEGERRGETAQFDAARAMRYLEDLCKIGPRISGTEGMKKQQALLEKHFTDLGGKVDFQQFRAEQKSQRQPVEMANLIVSWHPERSRRVILCSHYDTRPIADQEPDRRKWRDPFLSANDGGSGVALLMELAHQVKDIKTPVGIDFVFFDGEEYIFTPGPQGDIYFFGSEHFARNYLNQRSKSRYDAAILLDMIGGPNARFPIEQNSWFKAGTLVQQLWQTAMQEKCTAFQNTLGPEVLDDHIALNKAGIPTADIIDFSYPYWHRLSDIPANCSAASIAEVARVLVAWLQQVH